MTVGQLLGNTTSADLAEWMALYRMENEQRNPDEGVEVQLKKAFGKKRK